MKSSILNWLTAMAKDHCSHGKHNLVAAILHKRVPVSIGYNSYIKTHPNQLKVSEYPYLHAEVDAINKALNRVDKNLLNRCDLYVIRVKRNGSYGCSKPCENCQKYIEQVGIKRVHYFE